MLPSKYLLKLYTLQRLQRFNESRYSNNDRLTAGAAVSQADSLALLGARSKNNMYLMYYMSEENVRVYTLEVRRPVYINCQDLRLSGPFPAF